MPRILNPRWHDGLAAEYVLGTLHGRARARFVQLLRDDPALQARVAFWERELMPMAQPLSVAAPSEKLWQAIAARVAPREHTKVAAPSWLARWFSMPALGSLAAGLFLGVSAALIGPALLGGGAEQVSETQLPESYADGQTLFLWVIEADGKTRPIAPVPQGNYVQVQLAQTSEKLFASALELALSVEPAGAAPAMPSGPFAYRGLCGKLWRVKAASAQQ
jgi:anti-sigma-K factor RskA